MSDIQIQLISGFAGLALGAIGVMLPFWIDRARDALRDWRYRRVLRKVQREAEAMHQRVDDYIARRAAER